MKKSLNIALKDMLISFRDPTALLLMFVAPIVLTMIMGFAFGGSDDGPALEHIPVIVVNHDDGQFSPTLMEAFQSEDLAELLDASEMQNDQEARMAVDQNQAVAAIIIPQGFSDSIMPSGMLDQDITGQDLQNMQNRIASIVTIYADPASQISVSIVRSVVHIILTEFNSSISAGNTFFESALSNPNFNVDQLINMSDEEYQELFQPALENERITLEITEINPQSEVSFNWLSYTASGMAILFLMFTMTSSARSILSEKEDGTLPRLMVTPSSTFSIISGKMLGIFMLGFTQMLVLLLAGSLLFQINWGKTFDVVIFTLLLTMAAASWGIFISAVSKSPGQVSSIGSAVNLLFAAIGGSFVPRFDLPIWLKNISLFTPNALGIEGLTQLAEGGSLQTITIPILGCLITIVILISISSFAFRRQYQ
ncbi:MAG: ABC transporter permease [Anaerolineaceae bacterium]|nr:ABC transporter permease [Anaerolineaceae bacterium]